MPTGSVYDTVANVVNDVSIELGLGSVSDVYASTDANVVQMRQLLRSVGRDLMLVHPWRQLIKEFTLVTTSASAYNLPLDFSGVCEQSEWDRTNRWPVGGPLSPQEWQMVKAQLPNQTLNHLFFRVFDTTLEVWPQPPPTGRTVALEYVSRYWVRSNGQSSPDKDAPTANNDTLMFDAQLVTRALKLAFQKAKSLDTTSAQADYDATYALVNNANAAAGQVLPLWTRRRRFWGWMLGLAVLGNQVPDDASWYGAPLGSSAAADHLLFDTQPSAVMAGEAISPAVAVSVRDADGNLITIPNFSIAMTVSSGSLIGTTTVNTVNGVATFTGIGVAVGSAGAGFTLTATASGTIVTPSVTSSAFTVSQPNLAFDVQPGNTTAGVAFSPVVKVSLRDGSSALITATGVPVTIAASSGGLIGTLTANTVAGIATFTGVGPGGTVTGAHLTATATNCVSVDSSTYNATGAYFAFTTQPSAASCGSAAPTFAVTCYDGSGNVATGYAGICALSVLPNGYHTAIASGSTASFSSGVATFSAVNFQHFGTSVRLQATASGVTGVNGANSATFNVTAGALHHMAWIVSPPATVQKNVLTHEFTAGHKQISAGFYDVNNNLTGETSTIITGIYKDVGAGFIFWGIISSGLSTGHGTLEFDISTSQSDGATYAFGVNKSGISDLVGPGFVFSSATHHLVNSQPSDVEWTQAISPSFNVNLLNADGSTNTATGVNLVASGSIGGTTTVATTSGTSNFNALMGAATSDQLDTYITITGNGETGTTAAFNLRKPTLFFDVQPADTASGGNFSPTIQVRMRGVNGEGVNPATSVNVTLAISAGSTLTGTVTRTLSSGAVSFTGLGITGTGGNRQLTASASGYVSVTSNAFKVT